MTRHLRSRRVRRRLAGMRLVVSFLTLSALLSVPAFAQEAKKKELPVSEEMPSGMQGKKPTDVLRFEPLVIEGRVQAPQAVQVLRRGDVSFHELLPPESLLPLIVEAVESEPF